MKGLEILLKPLKNDVLEGTTYADDITRLFKAWETDIASVSKAGYPEVARAFNPVHLGIGYAIGTGTNEALDLIPGFKSQNKYLQDGFKPTSGLNIYFIAILKI